MKKKLRCYRCGRVLGRLDLESGLLELKCSRSKCGRVNTTRLSHEIGASHVPGARQHGAVDPVAIEAEPRVRPVERREGPEIVEGGASCPG
jgi:phage FluMu protein Com